MSWITPKLAFAVRQRQLKTLDYVIRLCNCFIVSFVYKLKNELQRRIWGGGRGGGGGGNAIQLKPYREQLS